MEDSYKIYPRGLKEYIQLYGWHFNKPLVEFATSHMTKDNDQPIKPYTKEMVTNLLNRFGIILKNNMGYDAVYVANMLKADMLNSSIIDEHHLAKGIKDYLDDPDGYPSIALTRYFADCCQKGIPIPWEDCI